MHSKHFLYLAILAFALTCCQTKLTKKDKPSDPGKMEHFEFDENSFMMKMQAEALQDSFIGITTTQGQQENLFRIKSTGVSTEPIIKSGLNYINSLSLDQQAKTIFEVHHDEWRKWSNVDNGIFKRAGVSLKELDSKQRDLAWQLLSTSLSVKGLQLSKDIMKTDQSLRELNNDNPIFDEELYYLTIMGEPSSTKPWGWQIDGHHLVINYFVLGDQVVMTPTFMGGEPILTTSGKYKGNTLFQDEQNLGLAFVKSLSKDQQKEAIISSEKSRNNAKAEAFKDNEVLDFQGLKGSRLSDAQKKTLLHLANQYISNMREGHALIRMEEIEDHMEETYFSWVGGLDEDAVFYYRIHSPVVLIEFDHQRAVGVKSNSRGPTRNHIHTVVRTPNGNDYGKDLLRQHLKNHH